MTDSIVIHPVSASADGKRNAYCLQCKKAEQSMSYAACLNRIAVVRSGADVPKDWNVCDDALRFHQCAAQTMRDEEELAGKSIYFVARDLLAAAGDAVRKWFMPGDPKTSRPAPEARRKARSMFDSMGDAGSYADAINGMSASEGAELMGRATTAPAAPVKAVVLPQALPGESPLAMARRLAAQKAAA